MPDTICETSSRADVEELLQAIEQRALDARNRIINKNRVKSTTEIDVLATEHNIRQWSISKELQERICFRVANGDTLDIICDGVEYPPFSVVDGWLQSDVDCVGNFREEFEKAMQTALRKLEWRLRSASKSSGQKRDALELASAKLEIDTARAILKAYFPKKWSDRSQSSEETFVEGRPHVIVLVASCASPDQQQIVEQFKHKLVSEL